MQSIKIFILFAVLALASVNGVEFDRQLKMSKSGATRSPNAKLGKGEKSDKCGSGKGGKSGKYDDDSCAPSSSPSDTPSVSPSLSSAPSLSPSGTPSVSPSLSSAPSLSPSGIPSGSPSLSSQPSGAKGSKGSTKGAKSRNLRF
eukprot:CAMPEP_0116100362 /NCGR_PEP_ID=MMETSP0327-20121206/12252_1 /TAXON_ID=44447 /ORGANISM="Pseudo-nitzschia delicatissima, Strain B596" /LENGTH=143 /DNA_ID=CAMNT_0003592283 /DNA_START=70 /DNA_END=501 /DNA_ORIENTATION=-